MNAPWYRKYFTEDYWALTQLKYTSERTARELAYLQEILEERAPGRRVVDLGCGIGRHAIGLAQDGFEVTGLDASEWAIDEAKRRAVRAGVDVRWGVVDLLAAEEWPLVRVDAAICIQSFGWGSDADQRRLLRRLRRCLTANGVLILALTSTSWILRNFVDSAQTTVGNATYSLQRKYDPANGRSKGSIIVSSPGKVDRMLLHDVRLYSTVELTQLLREAGFIIDRLDSDFTARHPVSMESRCVQLVAHPLLTPPASLAVASWRTPDGPRLDLRYAADETEWVDPSPDEIWEAFLNREGRRGANAAGYYPVDDPYGGERAAEVISEYFSCPMPPHLLTFGAGVTSLLHDMSGLADGGLVLSPSLAHPDLTAWAVANGVEVRLLDEPFTLDQLIAEIEAIRPSLLHLDRPTFAGELITLTDLQTIGRAASQVGTIVLVDESPSSYLGPASSIAPLIHQLDNLVVLRSLTKAYSRGGLRVGFVLASESVSSRVRELVPPLQVGELAYRAALRLLVAGDIFKRLRARISVTKPLMIELLEAFGLEVIKGYPTLPWVLVCDVGESASRTLSRCGIKGLRFVPSPALRGKAAELLHLSIPLSDERMALFRELLRSDGGSSG
ncbi:MAG: aminotransferase class I/II-fold pyridoxal phosphate-dependent enzyme [Ktedonobacteraceae bacterium]|nr:aminotransferase class I/II-fold pyridoxal phosphate-dependent enzyme [Ktedonobacteraceae bacterium]